MSVQVLDGSAKHDLGQEQDPLAKQIIKRQLNRSGNILMSAVEPLPDEEFFKGGSNGVSIAWTMGHLACVMDLFGSWLAHDKPQLPATIHKVFNSLDIGAKGPEKWETVDPQLHPKAEIMLWFRQAQIHLLQILEDFELRRWNQMPPAHVPDTLPTYGAVWEALGVHTYWHLGELSGSHERFFGTYTLNSVLHYFYVPPKAKGRA